MKGKLIIWLTGLMAVALLFAVSAAGETVRPAVDEQIAVQEKEYVKFECDPCDYNIDYGDMEHPEEPAGIKKSYIEFESDPYDYNIDYGEIDLPVKQ